MSRRRPVNMSRSIHPAATRSKRKLPPEPHSALVKSKATAGPPVLRGARHKPTPRLPRTANDSDVRRKETRKDVQYSARIQPHPSKNRASGKKDKAPERKLQSRFRRACSVAFRFEEALHFHRRHAARARRRDRLPVIAVLHVPRVEDTRHIRPRAAFGNNIPVFVQINLPPKWFGVRDMPDRDEEPVHFPLPRLPRLHIA